MKKLIKYLLLFVNRFEIIVLENQMKEVKENKMKNLIKLLCNKYQTEWYENNKKRKAKIKISKAKINKLEINNNPLFSK